MTYAMFQSVLILVLIAACLFALILFAVVNMILRHFNLADRYKYANKQISTLQETLQKERKDYERLDNITYTISEERDVNLAENKALHKRIHKMRTRGVLPAALNPRSYTLKRKRPY